MCSRVARALWAILVALTGPSGAQVPFPMPESQPMPDEGLMSGNSEPTPEPDSPQPPPELGLPQPAPMSGNPEPAPMSGNPQPAPMSGNPQPAPISGNPQPAPMSGNPQPAPMSGNPEPMSGNPQPAPMSGNPGPTPMSGNPEPAPMSGSPQPAPMSGNPQPAPISGNPQPAPMSGSPLPTPMQELLPTPMQAPMSGNNPQPTTVPTTTPAMMLPYPTPAPMPSPQDDANASSLCPAGFHAIKQNLGGQGEMWEEPNPSETRGIQDCADACNHRMACTSFEFAIGPSQHGACGTYTGGSSNIMSDEGRLKQESNWVSCIKLDPLCPWGYYSIKQNIGGPGETWEQPYLSTARTLEQCATSCNDRMGCTSFEYANGPFQHGACATYTGGDSNIMSDEGRTSQDSNWYSCMKEGQLCPMGYYAIKEDLNGPGEMWEQPNPDPVRSIHQCAASCDRRMGCTSFEFANGPSEHGSCGTYTGGTSNIMSDEGRVKKDSNWYSCMKLDAICPMGYYSIKENLDGPGEVWGQPNPDPVRSIHQCAATCNARLGCTSFEYANGPFQHGACGTYTGGNSNIKKDEGRTNKDANWYSCMKLDPLCPVGYYSIPENLDGKGEMWSQPNPDPVRSIHQCAASCDHRLGCTSFEYANGPRHHGACGTYTHGSSNVMKDEGRMNPASNWYTCVKVADAKPRQLLFGRRRRPSSNTRRGTVSSTRRRRSTSQTHRPSCWKTWQVVMIGVLGTLLGVCLGICCGICIGMKLAESSDEDSDTDMDPEE